MTAQFTMTNTCLKEQQQQPQGQWMEEARGKRNCVCVFIWRIEKWNKSQVEHPHHTKKNERAATTPIHS